MMASKKRRQSMIPTAGGGITNKKAKHNKEDVYSKDNLLCHLTQAAGLTLMNASTQNKLGVTKIAFQKQFAKALKNHKGDLLQNIESLIEDFEQYIEDPERFHKSLMPCTFCGDMESCSTAVPESTVRLLMGVELIQSPLMSSLLDKLLECLGDEEDYIFHMGQKVHIPRLVLSQFRFLDRIVDGKELMKKLLEVLQATNVEVQKEIIACIPDIVEDSEHAQVAKALRDELVSNKQLTCAVIDALTYLSIPTDLVVEVRTSVVDMLKRFGIEDLPIVVNFLLESCTAKDVLEVVNEIRSNMTFVTSLKLTEGEMEKMKTDVKLTIEALKGRMQFQKFVAEAWIKSIDSAKDSKVLDVFVLLLLHWLNNKKAVESLVRNKIRTGLITEALLAKAFKAPYTQVLRDYFPSILSLAQTLLRSPEPNICQIGCLMYKLAFENFDAYSQQEIVGNLVSHMGSGSTGEVDASLDILSDLVNTQLQAMVRYAVFVKGVLDYLDHNNLSVVQIRKLYLLLAKLAFHASQDGSYLQDDLHIIIRKQLTGVTKKYKRMGVMGAVSIVQALAGTEGPNDNDKQLSSEEYKLVIDLLELVQSSGKHDAETEALFLDTLASVMGAQALAENVESWIDSNMTKVFEESYVVDLEDGLTSSVALLPTESKYDLNRSEGDIGVDVTALVRKLYDKSLQQSAGPSPLCLCPLFHLVTICTKRQSDSSLEDIAALLGCPVMVPATEIYQRFEQLPVAEKDVICASLFLTINWFREVVNSFAPVDNAEMKGKVMLRLKHITELMDILEKCLGHHTTFQPQPVTFDMETSTAAPGPSTSGAKSSTGEKKRGRKGGKGKKGKENAENETILSQIDKGESQSSQLKSQADGAGEKSEEKKADLSAYRPYFRELDMGVFTILKAGLISRAALDSELNTRVTEQIQIDLPELQFLLEDLSVKLNHALVASASKRRSFFKTKEEKKVGFAKLDLYSTLQVAERVVEVLPCLLNHLEDACTFFQTQIADNDGLEDGPGKFSPESIRMGTCYHLLLQCLLSLYSWNGFGSEANKTLLKEALSVIVKRLRASEEESSFISQKDALKCAFQYFGNLEATVPNLDTAVTLVKLLMVLADKCQEQDLNQKLANHAKVFLAKEWCGADRQPLKGAKFNEQLQMMIKTYVIYSSNPLEALEELSSSGLAEIGSNEKENRDFVSLNKTTFSTYYKVVLSELISCVKRIPVGRKKDSLEVQEELLVSWLMAVKVLHVAVKLTKEFPVRSNLMSALKYGRQFVEIFLRQGMPLLDIAFRRHHKEVQNLLKMLQISTRTLHHLCGHSKITKDVSLTNQVPMLKRILEAFVYRVKAMLALNNCQEAFWMGNLKNRDLKGQEILTQNSIVSSGNTTACGDDDNDDEEEENQVSGDNDDSENSEVEMDNNVEDTVDSNADAGSYSEVF